MRRFRVLPDPPQAAIAAKARSAGMGFASDELRPVPMAEARHRLGISQHRFVVLHLGRMAPREGADTVIQGVAMLRALHGVDAELVIAGGDASGANGREAIELARLGNLASELGMSAYVRFAGQQPRTELRHYYSAANVFAIMPWYQPFATTPIEAMACARPVVGADVGDMRNTVLDGVTGYLVPARDSESLAERLARLQRRPDISRAMGDAGYAHACGHFTWQRIAHHVVAVVREVLDQSGSGAQGVAAASKEQK